MTVLYVLGGMSVFISLFSGYFNIKGKGALRLMCKTLASVLFFVVALFALSYKKEFSLYPILVLAALIFGVLGDVFLACPQLAKDDKRIIFDGLGIFNFAVGHIFFVAIFLFLSGVRFNFYLLPFLVVLPSVILVLKKTGVLKVGNKFLLAFIAYSTLLSLMAISAINLYIEVSTERNLLILIAGLLFTVSDSTLLLRSYTGREVKNLRPLVYVVLLTYYTAQVLFALTIAY